MRREIKCELAHFRSDGQRLAAWDLFDLEFLNRFRNCRLSIARLNGTQQRRYPTVAAARVYPRDRIEYRQGALVMARNYSDDGGTG